MFKYFFILLLVFPVFSGALSAEDFYFEGKRAFGQRNYKAADELFRKALQQNPGNGNPYFYRGYMKEYQNKNEEAIEFYKAGVSLQMDSDLKEKSFWKIVLYYKYRQDWQQLSVYSKKFLKFKKNSEVEKLRNLADENLRKSGPPEQSLIESGIQKMEEGDLEGARKDFVSALDKNPNFVFGLWNLALLEMKEERIPEAEELFRKLTTIKPDDWEYHYKLGICLYRLGNYENSLAEFEKARSLNSDQGKNFSHYINLSEGLVYLEMNRIGNAEKKFEESLSFRETGVALGGMSRCKMIQNKMDEAKSYAKKALENDPAQKDALLTLSLVHHFSSDEEQSIRFAEKYISEIKNAVYYTTPSTGFRVFLIYLADSAVSGNYRSNLDFAVEKLNGSFTDKIFEDKPKLQIPARDKPERTQRNYSSEDFYYYKGAYYRNAGNSDAAYESFQKSKDREDAYFYTAKNGLKKNSIKETIQLLKKSLQLSNSYREIIISDETFIKLSEEDPDFGEFFSSIKTSTPE